MKIFGLGALVLVLGSIALTACASGSANLEGRLWRMQSYRGADGQMLETLPDIKTTAEFTDGQVGGNAACNTYNGSYELDGDQINFGLMMTTMMACPQEVMDQETAYLVGLDQAATFEVTEDSLRILDADGEVVLAFSPVEPASLTSTNWLLTSYNNGKGGMQSLVIGSEISANFDEDGRMSGSAGCNTYSASYEATEGTINIGVVASTEMACMDPEGIMEQESTIMSMLSKTVSYSIEGGKLYLQVEGGEMLVFTPLDSAE